VPAPTIPSQAERSAAVRAENAAKVAAGFTLARPRAARKAKPAAKPAPVGCRTCKILGDLCVACRAIDARSAAE
jgi:tryptophan synthase alpha subunit